MPASLMNSQLQETIKSAIQTRLSLDIFPDCTFYLYYLPVLLLLVGGLISMILGVFTSKPSKPSYPVWCLAILICFLSAASSILFTMNTPPRAFLGSAILLDQISGISFAVIAIFSLFTLVAVALTEVGKQLLRFELLTLFLFSSAGLMIMCSSGEFVSFFLGLELTSISLYVLVGYQRKSMEGLEAAVKYFILGATAAAIVLMGAALIYASIGSLRFADFQYLNVSISNPFALLGVLLFFCGISFKLAIAPFHSWAPDVYQGANSHLTGYMASLVKFSVAIVFLRILSETSNNSSIFSELIPLFWMFAAVSIVVGSLFGLVHNSLKRMLAYSSIANAGYLCLAFTTLAKDPTNISAKQSILTYAIIYAILSIGAFTVIAWFEDQNREDLLKEELAGIGEKKPLAAFSLTVFLLGLGGIPPIAGFFGKFFILLAAVNQGFIGLAIILVICSCISLYYYLSVIIEIWFKPQTRYTIKNSQAKETNSGLNSLTFICLVASFAGGLLVPYWTTHLDYTQATEKNLRIINTSATTNLPIENK